MNEHLEKSDRGSDETLRVYLLCSLAEAERLQLDERLLVDDEFAERLRIAESELMDDFAAGRLSAVEQDLFTRNFLVTDERRKKLGFTSALRDYARLQTSPPILPAGISWQERIAGFLGLHRNPAWALGGAFAILVLVIGLAWLVMRQSRPAEPLIARNDPVTSASPQPSTQNPSATPGPETPRASNATPTPSEPVMPPVVASFVLLPGATRGSGDMTRIAVPKGERATVRLDLVLENPGEGVYDAELATAEGQKVLVRNKLKPTRNGHLKVVLTIPAQLLHSRDYQIKLSVQTADGESHSAGRYYFRALEE